MPVPDAIRSARSFKGIPPRRPAKFQFVVQQWAFPPSAAGIVYLYENVGFQLTSAPAGIEYLYENVGLTFDPTKNQPGVQYAYDNVGLPPTYWPIIGRVIAALNDTYGVVYLYENVT